MENSHINSNTKADTTDSSSTDSSCDKENSPKKCPSTNSSDATQEKAFDHDYISSKSKSVEPLDPEDQQALDHIEKQLAQNHTNGVDIPDKVFDDSTRGIDIGQAPVSEEARKRADELKEEANSFFKKNDFFKAIELYTRAIELAPSAVYYSNRALAYIRDESIGYALQDATSAINLDPNYIKAYYRRACANMTLGKFQLALKDLETVARTHPNDKDAQDKYKKCKQVAFKQAFEKAIASDKPEAPTDSEEVANADKIALEPDYAGPRFEVREGEPQLTLDFVKQLLDTFKAQKKLHRKFAIQMVKRVREYLKVMPSLVEINVPSGQKFTICGDIHGQFYDLMNIFELNGLPSEENPYLFNGDFVDRGSFSVESIFTLFALKLLYPKSLYLARGNHESLTMNQMYGFEGEVKAKYNEALSRLFTDTFNYLPLAHLLRLGASGSERVLVMHGGLFSDDDVTLKQLVEIDRVRQPPEAGLMCEILWSDPQFSNGRSPSKRGVGCQFGPDVTKRFCELNGLRYIVRSHEVKQEGYEVAHGGKCITVFSAPNYCDTMGNKGAFITITGDNPDPHFVSYKAVPHPSVRPMQYANPLMSLFG